jgi:hypothetical protein
VHIVYYHANRQLWGKNLTWAAVVTETLSSKAGITLPYNMPAWGAEPKFYLDMTASGEKINPVSKGLTTDVFDSTYWGAQLITANVMPWLPFFSNCKGYDSRIVFYDLFEYNDKCILPT